MICIAGNMPVIQVGDYQVVNYETYWIHRAIKNAADRANQPEFAFTDDVYEGVVYYLENKCPLRLLELETLYERIRHTLKRIGCEPIANALRIEAPPVTVSLEIAAERAIESSGFELAFYQILQQEMKALKNLGANEIFFSDIRKSILHLKQTEEWTPSCDQQEQDILLWLKDAGTTPIRQGRRIRCMLKHVVA